MKNDKDLIDEIFLSTNNIDLTDASEELDNSTLIIDLNEVNEMARNEATQITERLSNYFFDKTYIEEHPYIPSKIKQEMNNIRRLIKMLSVNESAQDSLIQSITSFSGKGSLYSSLTALQSTMLSIQKQLDEKTASLESIFEDMQKSCEETWTERDKEISEDGSITVIGSRDFIKQLREQQENKENKPDINEETGEITVNTNN